MYGDPADPGKEAMEARPEMPSYTRAWSFDPYHQGLGFARSQDPGERRADTEWMVYEVFQQDHRGEHHHHVGSLHAPDGEIALVLAKENFARRGDCVNLWVVPAHCIHATDYADADVFEHTTDRMYREPGGFQGLRRDKIHGRALRDDHVEGVLKTAETEMEAARRKEGRR
jgi:ring-1,2-phenylacetyl-CoA epoxidase subunit PaaB